MSRAYDKIRTGLLEALAVANGSQLGANYLASPARDGAPQKKGGSPEDARRSSVMSNVAKIHVGDNGEAARMGAARTALQRKLSSMGQRSTSEIVTITPEMAVAILERNPPSENRKVSATVVDRYAADMAAGRWQGLNGQTIVLSASGDLNDGQHRLHAIMESGVPVETIVVYGADRASRLTLDQNRVRTSGDYLEMVGIANAANTAAAAKMVMQAEAGHFGRLKHAAAGGETKAAIHAFVVENLDALKRGFEEIGSDWKNMPAPPSRVVAALLLIVRKTGRWEDASSFIRSVLGGEGLTKTSPAYQARERLLADKITRTQTPIRTIEAFIRAWNMHQTGRRTTRFTLNGSLPEVQG